MSSRISTVITLPHHLALRPDGSFDADIYTDAVVRAEGLGYDHTMTPDHVFVPEYWAKVVGDAWVDPFTLLSYVAARTSRIGLLLSCLVVPYRQPFATAEMVATLDQLSQGRFQLGIVPGYLKEEFETFGLPLEDRNEMTNEFMRIMIELWASDSASYQGKYYQCENVDVRPKCVHRPHVPIWVGGSSKQAMRRVAEFGDVWHPLGGPVIDEAYTSAHTRELAGKPLPTSGTTPDKLRNGIEFIRQLADEAGRDISHLHDRVRGQPARRQPGSLRRAPRALRYRGPPEALTALRSRPVRAQRLRG
jgi:probable F420-dependent oxidoreductase